MKNVVMGLAFAAVAASMVGCQSTNVDEWRSDLKTQLCPAKFTPVYEVMKDKGIVSGEATESWTRCFLGNGSDTFAGQACWREGSPLHLLRVHARGQGRQVHG